MKDKFNAFKGHAERHSIKRGFACDIDDDLFIKNTNDISCEN